MVKIKCISEELRSEEWDEVPTSLGSRIQIPNTGQTVQRLTINVNMDFGFTNDFQFQTTLGWWLLLPITRPTTSTFSHYLKKGNECTTLIAAPRDYITPWMALLLYWKVRNVYKALDVWISDGDLKEIYISPTSLKECPSEMFQTVHIKNEWWIVHRTVELMTLPTVDVAKEGSEESSMSFEPGSSRSDGESVEEKSLLDHSVSSFGSTNEVFLDTGAAAQTVTNNFHSSKELVLLDLEINEDLKPDGCGSRPRQDVENPLQATSLSTSGPNLDVLLKKSAEHPTSMSTSKPLNSGLIDMETNDVWKHGSGGSDGGTDEEKILLDNSVPTFVSGMVDFMDTGVEARTIMNDAHPCNEVGLLDMEIPVDLKMKKKMKKKGFWRSLRRGVMAPIRWCGRCCRGED